MLPISTLIRITVVIATGMLMTGKTNLVYPKRLKSTKVPESIRAVHSLGQIKRIKRPLYVSLKHEGQQLLFQIKL